jgi:NAD(P)-dependent dehydrogenase (short-subunit alcohol dehydrogenase family)
MKTKERKKPAAATKKVALVTGAGRGLGAAIAQWLGEQDYRVAVHYHASAVGAKKTLAALEKSGGEGKLFCADLTSLARAEQLGAEIKKTWGRLDVLINNSGVFEPRFLEEFTEAEWRRGLDTTVTATYNTSRACLPLLRQSSAGRLINIGDSLCQNAGFAEPAFSYYLGKVGVWMLTQTLAVQEAPHGLTVNCVSPGILEQSVPLTSVGTYPMQRSMRYDDLFGAIQYLLSPAASQVTGTNLLVSGGWNIAPLFRTILEGNREPLRQWVKKLPRRSN